MVQKIDWRAPRGTHDILPADEAVWRFVMGIIERRARGFGMGRIETPIFERAELFQRSLGETTDVVTKELFEVNHYVTEVGEEGTHYALRPEGTASILRAYLEHGMHVWPQPIKLWHMGPMFRAERPQKGRYRQFWSAGFEVIGDADPTVDALLIHLAWQIMGDLALRDQIVVDINSIGDNLCRPKYRKALVAYYQDVREQLCPTCQERLLKNPLRLLDCKEASCTELKADAPQMFDHLCTNCREHFRVVLESLDELGVVYDLNPNLVRGLDYYTRTAFEIRAKDDDGRQAALTGGGRYDNLLGELSTKSTAGVGFAIGIERLIEKVIATGLEIPNLQTADVFLIQLGERAKKASFNVLAKLTDSGLTVICQAGQEGLKDQLGLADKARVRFALIIGQREALDETVIVRDMFEATQETILQKDILKVLTDRISSSQNPQ